MTPSDQQAPESESEQEARAVLTQHLGLLARKIPTTDERTADYEVDGDTFGYVVEVKSRNLPAQISNLRPEHGATSLVRPMRHDDAVGGYLSDAKQQMRAVDPLHERLWFLWASADSPFDSDAQAERIFSSLYGFRRAVEVVPPHRQLACYYAGRSAFDRFPEIDGVIVYRTEGSEAELRFCVNEGSPRIEDVLASRLARGFKPNIPSRNAREGEICVPRGLLASDGETAVLKYVQAATGIARLTFWGQEVQYLGAISVDVRGNAPPSPQGEG